MALIKLNSRAIPDDTVIASDIADGSISTAKLAADAVTTPKIADTVNLGRRNLIINGDFQIFQRATSATNPGGGYDTADRWRSSQNSTGLGNYNAEQSTDTPNGFGFSYKLTKTDVTTQNSNNSAYIQQYIEGQNVQHLNYGSSSAKKLTASFHVKSSVTGTYGVRLGDGEAGKHNVQTFTISSANTWEKKVITFNGDTATALANDNSAELDFAIVLGAGSNYQTSSTNTWASGDKKSTSSQTQWTETNGATFYITGVQLEVGDTATPFEHRSFGEELSLCQRYYEVVGTTPNSLLFQNEPNTTTGGACRTSVTYIEKRVAPTASINGTWSFGNGNTFVVSAAGLNSTRYDWTSTTTTSESFVYNSNAGATLSFDAEL